MGRLLIKMSQVLWRMWAQETGNLYIIFIETEIGSTIVWNTGEFSKELRLALQKYLPIALLDIHMKGKNISKRHMHCCVHGNLTIDKIWKILNTPDRLGTSLTIASMSPIGPYKPLFLCSLCLSLSLILSHAHTPVYKKKILLFVTL